MSYPNFLVNRPQIKQRTHEERDKHSPGKFFTIVLIETLKNCPIEIQKCH